MNAVSGPGQRLPRVLTVQGYAAGTTFAGGGTIGARNSVTDFFGTVGGGAANQAGNGNFTINNANFATVGCGELNTASGGHATLPGDQFNTAAGAFSFAAGRNATSNHTATFVWDSGTTPFTSTKQQCFIINVSGGVGIGTADPTAKPEIGDVAGTDGIKFPDGTVQTTAYRRLKVSAVFYPPANTGRAATYVALRPCGIEARRYAGVRA